MIKNQPNWEDNSAHFSHHLELVSPPPHFLPRQCLPLIIRLKYIHYFCQIWYSSLEIILMKPELLILWLSQHPMQTWFCGWKSHNRVRTRKGRESVGEVFIIIIITAVYIASLLFASFPLGPRAFLLHLQSVLKFLPSNWEDKRDVQDWAMNAWRASEFLHDYNLRRWMATSASHYIKILPLALGVVNVLFIYFYKTSSISTATNGL